MVLMDTLKIIIGLLVLCGITLAAPPENGIHESKRIQSSGKPDHYISQTTVDSPNKYSDPYDLPPDQIEISEKYEEPQRHQTHLQDEYHEEKTIEYMDDKKVVPQSYKFGFEIKDKKEGMQFRQEEKDEHGTIQGRFGYRDAKGQYRHVEYVADNHGFRANIKTNEAGLTNENPANVKMHLEDNTAHYPPSKPTAPYAEQHPEVHKTTESVSESDHHNQQAVEEDTRYKTPRRSPLQNYPGYEAYRHQKQDDHEVTYYRDSPKPPAEKPRSHTPRSYNYFVKERNPHTGYEHSSVESEPHQESPRPSHPSQDSPPKSTYQYELEGDRYQYKYVKRPSHSDREASQDYEEQDYRAPKYDYQDEYGHEASPKHHPSGDYEGHRNREIPGYKRRVILPQREPHQTHEYQRDHQDNDEQDYRMVQFGYPQGPENEEEEKQSKAVAHQYVQVENEPQQPSEYEQSHPSPYGYRPREKEVQPGHSVVYVHREPEVKHEPEHSYGNQDSEHQGIKYKPYHAVKLDSLTGYHGSSAPKPSEYTNGRLKIGKVPKKAVLELNPEVYKKLIENKSPGTRFVAVPLNENADKKSHRGSPQPHGILHIPLNGETPSSLDLKSLVLQIPQKPQEEKFEQPILKYRDYIEQAKRKHEAYNLEEQPQITPIYKPIRQHNKDYSKTKWIPLTPSHNQGRRKVPYEVNTQSAPDSSIQAPHGYRLQVSNEEAYKLLPGESSLSSVGFKRRSEVSSNKEISSLSRKKSPRLYVLGSSFGNITPLTDLKRLATMSLPRS